MNKILVYIFLFFLFISPLYPDENYLDLFEDNSDDLTKEDNSASGQNEFAVKNDFMLEINGEHSFTFHFPTDKDHFDFEGNIKAPRFRNDMGLEIKYKELKLVSNGRFDILLNDFSVWYKVLKIQPLENYIRWSPWKLTFTAGYQFYNWGVADQLNPTDNINPRDFTTGMKADKLPALSLSAKIYPLDFFSIEAIYVPFEQNDVFPVDVISKIPDKLFYKKSSNTSYDDFDFNPVCFLLGGKVNFFFSSIDFSFSYLYDFDNSWTPVITMEIPTGYFYNVEEIQFERKRIHRFGADVKGNIDRVSLWLEVCYSLSEDYLLNDYRVRNHNFQWVTGFDTTLGPDDLFYINFQIMGEFIPFFDDGFYKDYEDGLPDADEADNEKYMEEYYYRVLTDKLGSYQEGLNLGAFIKLKWKFLNELLVPEISTGYVVPLIYDYDKYDRYGALYLKPLVDIMPFDSFHITVGAELYFSWKYDADEKEWTSDSYKMGNYVNDSNIYLTIKYKWNYQFRK